MPSWGPTCGRNGGINRAVLGVPQTVEDTKNGNITPCGCRARLWAKWLDNPHRLGGPQSVEGIIEGYITLAIATSKEGGKLRWIHNPCCLGGPEAGKKS